MDIITASGFSVESIFERVLNYNEPEKDISFVLSKLVNMKSITWLYLKMFLIFGLGYGILISLVDLLFGGGFQFDQFIRRSLTFGILMSGILVSIHVLGLRGKGVKKFSTSILSPVQKRSISSVLDKNKVVEKISTDPVLNKMEIKETENGVILKSAMSLFSYGNRISIQGDAGHGAMNHYEIVSRPVAITTLLDYGTSYNQVTRLEKLMIQENA